MSRPSIMILFSSTQNWLCFIFILIHGGNGKYLKHDPQPDPEVLKLSHVIVLYRHGDRTPVDPYPNDPFKDPKFWPVGFGQLTNIGKNMQFELGKYLRHRYSNFLNESYSEKDIYVRSTDFDRTLMSAYSNLAGLYPPKGDQIWNPAINWQPIPVHTVSDSEDNLLSSHFFCPKLTYLVDHLSDQPDVKEIDSKYKTLYDYLTEKTGAKVNNMVQVDYIFDTLYIQEIYNFTLPEWTKGVYPEKMVFLRDLSFRATTWTKEMKRLRSGPLIQSIVDHFAVTANETDIRPKFVMYSGHDTSISSLLNSLDMFEPPIAPPYASMVIIELFFRELDDKYFVKFSYRNDTTRDPYVLNVMGRCGDFCPLDEFIELTSPVRPRNWTKECTTGFGNGHEDPTISMITNLSMVVSGFLFVILAVSVVVSFCSRKRPLEQSHPYRTINQEY